MRQIDRAISISDRLMGWNMLESASGVLERALEQHPYNPELLRRLGRVRLAQGLPQEAVPFLKLAIAHDQLSGRSKASARGHGPDADAARPQAGRPG